MAAPAVLIMAAGEGTRMRSSLPKPLHPVCGRPMIAWPVLAAQEAGAGRVAVIVSPDRDLSDALPEGAEQVVQPEADGTGGAVRAAAELIEAADTVLVLPGDHPLIAASLIGDLLEAHADAGAAATVMTIELDDPGSYGRIVRDDDDAVREIVETKHPESVAAEVLATREISTSTFAFDAAPLSEALAQLRNDNEAGEYYLGDVLPLLRAAGHAVAAHKATDPAANLGVNTRADLALVAEEARRRIANRHMLAGVTIIDPGATWIDADVEIGADVTIEPGCVLRGATRIGSGSELRAHSYVLDAEVGERCSVGPFAYLRPDARLAAGAKAGTFVEIKNSEIGEGAKVPHLSYVGDADVGAGSNLGAGTITANYDGQKKSRTKIGEGARIGVDTALVAPVEVGDDAYTGAGAVIREDVPPGSLAVSAGEQRNIEGYAERKGKQATDQDSKGDTGEER